jgi:hypothetical protein
MRITNGMPQARDYHPGLRQQLILEDGSQLDMMVNNRHIHTDGTVAVDAIIPGTPEGKLHMEWNQHDGFFLGQIEYLHSPIAYEITQDNHGQPTITRRSIDQLVCAEINNLNQEVTYGLPAVEETTAAEAETPDETSSEEEATAPIPPLNSYPSAAAVVYLDFDGEVVTGTSWGDRIVAEATGYSAAKVTDVWKRVATDMEPFNLNVTTEESVYLNAEPSKRIRCIITPSNDWYPGTSTAGGVAKLGSFTWSGDTPCWIFSNNLYDVPKYLAEACSHELGHTFGLNHDGKSGVTSYYAGHGSGAVGWAPIMGNSYSKELTQWSKGEYSNPTNTEDDLSIITSSSNGFGYRSDDHTNQSQGATPMPKDDADHISGLGVIEKQGDVDVFSMESGPGSLSLDVSPANTISNLDIEIALYDEQGILIATANPATQLNASINATVESGTYFLHVRATGYGTPDTGSSDYASLGAYKIDGQVAAAALPPTPYELTVQDLPESDQLQDCDPDGDGLNNLAEHLLGTNPSVADAPHDYTHIESSSPSRVDFLIDLPANMPDDAIYTVEATCHLHADDWVAIASWNATDGWVSLSSTSTVNITEETGSDGRHHFRISHSFEEKLTCQFMRLGLQLANTSP